MAELLPQDQYCPCCNGTGRVDKATANRWGNLRPELLMMDESANLTWGKLCSAVSGRSRAKDFDSLVKRVNETMDSIRMLSPLWQDK